MELKRVSSNLLAGLLERLVDAPYHGRADLPAIAEALQLEADDLLAIAESLQLLRFAELEEGDIRVTAAAALSRPASSMSVSVCSPSMPWPMSR
jgi:NitT/TauT family transport system ATP-binding protein